MTLPRSLGRSSCRKPGPRSGTRSYPHAGSGLPAEQQKEPPGSQTTRCEDGNHRGEDITVPQKGLLGTPKPKSPPRQQALI